MFNLDAQAKIPSLRPEVDGRDEDVRYLDWKSKVEGKRYADQRRGTSNSQAAAGDLVLVKIYTEPKFKPEPYEVVNRQVNGVE